MELLDFFKEMANAAHFNNDADLILSKQGREIKYAYLLNNEFIVDCILSDGNEPLSERTIYETAVCEVPACGFSCVE